MKTEDQESLVRIEAIAFANMSMLIMICLKTTNEDVAREATTQYNHTLDVLEANGAGPFERI